MDPDLLARVLGREPPSGTVERAILTGFRRCVIRGRAYPMLLRAAGGRVDGLLVHDLTEPDAVRLTWYESDGYEIRRCRPRQAAGRRVVAWTYLSASRDMVPGGNWDLASWQRQRKAKSLAAIEREIADGGPTPPELAAAHAAWRRRKP